MNVPLGISTSFTPMLLVIVLGDWANKQDAANVQHKKAEKQKSDCRRFIQNLLNLKRPRRATEVRITLDFSHRKSIKILSKNCNHQGRID
jgi:hypothetical protein